MGTERRAAQPDATRPSEDGARRMDTTGDAIENGDATLAILEQLETEADDFISTGHVVDAAWTRSAAGLLARTIADGDGAHVIRAQEVFRRLTSAARRAQNNARRSETATASESALRNLDRISVLVEVADAASTIVRPREAANVAWGTLSARILLALTQDDRTPNEVLHSVVETTTPQLSRECKRLLERGLITRRYAGKNVSWALTGNGVETADQLRRLDRRPPVSPPVISTDDPVRAAAPAAKTSDTGEVTLADSIASFKHAAYRDVPAILVRAAFNERPATSGADLDCMDGVLYRRTNNVEHLDDGDWSLSENPPEVLLDASNHTAYVQIDEFDPTA